jgi:hypothetical protein
MQLQTAAAKASACVSNGLDTPVFQVRGAQSRVLPNLGCNNLAPILQVKLESSLQPIVDDLSYLLQPGDLLAAAAYVDAEVGDKWWLLLQEHAEPKHAEPR